MFLPSKQAIGVRFPSPAPIFTLILASFMNELIVADIQGRLKTSGRHLVFVCGLPGSGKSTFCLEYSQLPNLRGPVLHSDWYANYATPVRRARIANALKSGDSEQIEAEEDPRNWYDWNRLFQDLKILRDTGRLQITDGWDQTTGNKGLKVELVAGVNELIWVDGIQLLNDPIVSLSDLVILLKTSPSVANERGVVRDSHRSDALYLAYKASLTQKYEVPYFAKYSKVADMEIDNFDFENPLLLK
jgi:uridine kinase